MSGSLLGPDPSLGIARRAGSIHSGFGIDTPFIRGPFWTSTFSISQSSAVAILSVLDAAHSLVGQAIRSGDLAIDATIGNGYDTLFLLREVGAEGQVVGFDVQMDALDATRHRVQRQASETADRLRLVHDGHEAMTAHLDDEAVGAVGAVMFNLGYLPGGDHSIITEPETTCAALNTSAELLRPGGVITIVAYSGHAGGKDEVRAVESWTASLPQDEFRALSYQFVNQMNDPPRLFAVEKHSV